MNQTVILSNNEVKEIEYDFLKQHYEEYLSKMVTLMNENADLKAEIKQLKWRLAQQD